MAPEGESLKEDETIELIWSFSLMQRATDGLCVEDLLVHEKLHVGVTECFQETEAELFLKV